MKIIQETPFMPVTLVLETQTEVTAVRVSLGLVGLTKLKERKELIAPFSPEEVDHAVYSIFDKLADIDVTSEHYKGPKGKK